MTQETLFELEESLSPYRAFLQKHDIHTHHAPHCQHAPFSAWYSISLNDALENHGPDFFGYGKTEKEAILDLAEKHQLDGYNSFDWNL